MLGIEMMKVNSAEDREHFMLPAVSEKMDRDFVTPEMVIRIMRLIAEDPNMDLNDNRQLLHNIGRCMSCDGKGECWGMTMSDELPVLVHGIMQTGHEGKRCETMSNNLKLIADFVSDMRFDELMSVHITIIDNGSNSKCLIQQAGPVIAGEEEEDQEARDAVFDLLPMSRRKLIPSSVDMAAYAINHGWGENGDEWMMAVVGKLLSMRSDELKRNPQSHGLNIGALLSRLGG